jgi:hypothetical protein
MSHMDSKNLNLKYLKYKTKYLELKNMSTNNQIGGESLFSVNERNLFNANITKMSTKIIKLKDVTKLIDFINKSSNKKLYSTF